MCGRLTLIGLIYGALLGDSSWQDFLEGVSGRLPNGQALLFHHDVRRHAGAMTITSGIEEASLAAYNDHYARLNPWMGHAAVRPLGRVVQADEMLPRDELKTTEFYNEFLDPQGVETGFGATLRRQNGVNLLFSALCADLSDREACDTKRMLQVLVPHLAIAFDHYRRPEAPAGNAARASVYVSARQGVVRIGAGAKVLDADADALRLAEETDDLALHGFGLLRCSVPALAEHIETELTKCALGAPPSEGSLRIFYLRRRGSGPPLRVIVYRAAHDEVAAFFRGPQCILLIEDPGASISLAAREFAQLYSLTNAEQRIVHELSRGRDIKSIAKRSERSLETVRAQVKSIQSKTGLNRQSEIVRQVALIAGGMRG